MKLIWGYVVLGFAAVACGDSNDNNLNHLPDGGTPTDVVTKTTPEPAGSNCQYGGTEVQVGVDANGNGMLDPDEVQSTFYVCDQAPTPDPLANVYYGELVISSPADLAAAQSYTGIIGDLIISPATDTAALAVELPNLTFITGQITDCVDGEGGPGGAVARARAPVAQAATVNLAALQSVGEIDVECSSGIASLSFPALTGIHGGLGILDPISSWSAPTLATIDESIFIANTNLTTLTLPAPISNLTADVSILDNALLDDCAVDDLAGSMRRAGFRGSINVGGNGQGSGSGEGSGDEGGCADATHICQSVTIGGDATDWRECYQSTDFSDARSLCQAVGSGWDLAYVTSLDDEQTIGSLSYMTNTRYWIGYYQVAADDPYTWVQAPAAQTFAPQSSSDPTDGAFWNPGEPSGDADPDCVQIYLSDPLDATSVVANDIPCGNGYAPLCRYLTPSQ